MFWGNDVRQLVWRRAAVIGVSSSAREMASTAVWFEPVNRPDKLLLYSFLFGIIHLFAGLAVRFYMLWKDGKKFDAFCDVIPVYLLVAGIAPLGAGIIIDVPQTLTTIGKYVALCRRGADRSDERASAKNIIGKLGGGLTGCITRRPDISEISYPIRAAESASDFRLVL